MTRENLVNEGAFDYELRTQTNSNFTELYAKTQASAVTSALTKNASTTLESITGLSATLVAGGTYVVRVVLPCTAGASGGIKVALNTSDTLTLTSSNITAKIMTASALAVATTTSGLNTGVGATSAAVLVELSATVVVNAAGTLVVQAAQNASNGTDTVVLANGSMTVIRV